MIVVDRPGIGATPVVPLDQRIQVSCRKSLPALSLARSWAKSSPRRIRPGASEGKTSTSPSSLSRDLVRPSSAISKFS
jgi:hypothetical protein